MWKSVRFRRRTCFAIFFAIFVSSVKCLEFMSGENLNAENGPLVFTEFTSVNIIEGKVTLEKKFSPYIVRDDIVIHSNGELVIEPGVEVRFAPMVGITVYGALIAEGNPEERVVLTSLHEFDSTFRTGSDVRLVDGPNILVGRLQIWYNNGWRSVCTNSRNWTVADMEIVCRQLGFQGGSWWNWVDRESGISKPRMVLENPSCRGTEATLMECANWSRKQLGSGACEYHPDIGIQCSPRYENIRSIGNHWRGIEFQNARFQKVLTNHNTLYVKSSASMLSNVIIRYAGSGRDYVAGSAIHIVGVPPLISSVSVVFSAYNGINITDPGTPFVIRNSSVTGSRGYGVYVNSSVGHVLLKDSVVSENGADGIRYVHHDSNIIERSDLLDFCTFPMTASQTYPMSISFEQNVMSHQKSCHKYFFTRSDQVLTLYFQKMTTDKNDSSTIEIYDGSGTTDPLLARVFVKNATKPQSVTTFRNNVFVRFQAEAKTEVLVIMKIFSSYGKWYDLNITDCSIESNEGRGIVAENTRGQLYIKGSSISKNKRLAGVHVLKGASVVNVTLSTISFNHGDGVNISYTGGSRNVSKSSITGNRGFGVAVWLNETKHDEYVSYTQDTVVAYNKIFDNIESGIWVGNFCGNSLVNISGNYFNHSYESCINVKSCVKRNAGLLRLQIGNNFFSNNRKQAIKLTPLVNAEAVIEFNHFVKHTYGAVLIKNGICEEHRLLPAKVVVKNNEFFDNGGVYVINIGLSPYSEVQKLLFTWNFVKENKVKEPFDQMEAGRLIPRSRVAAVLVVSSENVNIFRNIFQNHESKYEIGSHLEDQSLVINCTYNWLGYSSEEKIFSRLFHRKDRYNLAKIEFLPYLLHSSNPAASTIMSFSTYVPEFYSIGSSRTVGGEVDGLETLRSGDYFVERDINVRPGGRLALEPGVTLRFPPGIGIMVAGKLEARGRGPSDVKFTLAENYLTAPNDGNVTDETVLVSSSGPPVRLFGGRTQYEGRLQVKINDKWGTVCNYGWNIQDAALACHQLGLILNRNDWFLDHLEIPQAGSSDPILLSNVQCSDEDLDITLCRSERYPDFENSCTHNEDVGLRCYEPKWAGIRFGVLAERSNLQYIAIEHAGLLDYSRNILKPALQIDFNRHALENVRIIDNIDDGLGIIYSDLYSVGIGSNVAKNCDFINNKGSGISIKQFGLKVSNCNIMDNKVAGIRHDPVISTEQQQELTGWFKPMADVVTQYTPYNPIFLPSSDENIELSGEETKYLITERISNSAQSINRTYFIKAKPGFVLGIQLLNPIHNSSTEEIIIVDNPSETSQALRWNLKTDLAVFPTITRTLGIVLDYKSGTNALGEVVLIVTSMLSQYYDSSNRIENAKFGPLLSLSNTKVKRNRRGIWNSYYNRYLSPVGEHYLRKGNESVWVLNCDISYNEEEAILVTSPYWDKTVSNISEITVVINGSLITDNGRGIYQSGRDLQNSNNLFHWYASGCYIERNDVGNFHISLPYVWQYNENYTHSVVLHNNTWRDNRHFSLIIDGHYARFNMTYNEFENNICKDGLISIKGMEKSLHINRNTIKYNIGAYVIEFKANSQSEIRGELRAVFSENILKKNNAPSSEVPSSLIVFDGIQRVRVKKNLLSENNQAYVLVAGVKTAQLDSKLDVTENWWGTTDSTDIKRMIFDFDDWNDHALAIFKPYLMKDDIEGPVSVSWDHPTLSTEDSLSGRLLHSLVLHPQSRPYQVHADLTVMPDVTLTIMPGTVIEFAPRVGILVLGTLIARGERNDPIIMKPMKQAKMRTQSTAKYPRSLRLCTGYNCTNEAENREGFLEYWNSTTLQWVPICDSRFTEHNAEVVCRELGLETLNAWVSHGRRYEYVPNALMRIWSWPEPLQCIGTEKSLEECPIRLNGQLHEKKHFCSWDSMFVFIHCGDRNLNFHMDYWGGIRFADSQFESSNFEDRIHDAVTHETSRKGESVLQNVRIMGAGLLHYHKSPAVLAVRKSPEIGVVNVSQCASNGISFVSPERELKLLSSRVEGCLGTGISVASLTGEGRESSESSFSPVGKVELPYHTFGLLDMCDPIKEIVIQERILLYYKYSNIPVTCIKIFHSTFLVKRFGFRFLQFNLLDKSDKLVLYDGSIYNSSSTIIKTIYAESGVKKQLIKTRGPSLSIKMIVSGATRYHGFIAEVVTLPISAIGFNRDVQHNMSYTVLDNNWGGAMYYVSAGEVNPRLTLEWNQITNNCESFYGGNFTSCDSSLHMDLQNTQNVYFRNNLVMNNEGGLWIRADSRGSATSLKCWIHNNLFTGNRHLPVLKIEGRKTSPYQEVVVYRNYWTKNYAPYDNVITLDQVVSNFTFNYVHNNVGKHVLEVSGFKGVRLPIYQTTSHNGFYWNYATDRDSRGTILAGTAGQHYIDNILFNPDNDYEIVTVNHSEVDVWKTPIDARHNYWGYNESLAVSGRIKDFSDDYNLLEVDFRPFQITNSTILDRKCPPSWNLVGDTCYIYIGAPMSFFAARDFCRSANSSMPYVGDNYEALLRFLSIQQEYYTFYDRVWVQNIDKINRCTVFVYGEIEEDNCDHLHPFLCEMDPKVVINPLVWQSDILTLWVLFSALLALLLLTLVSIFWYKKSRHRHVERLQRRNSIRQSLNSLRSISSSQGGFSEFGLKRKALSVQQSSPSLMKKTEYKKMNGSVDSVEKSQFNSSLEDVPSYVTYESQPPAMIEQVSVCKYDLAFQNQGYRDNSTFASADNSTWQSTDYINNSSTLPLNVTLTPMGNSSVTLSSRQDYQQENEYNVYYERPKSSAVLETSLDEPGLPAVPPRSRSEMLLETNLDSPQLRYSDSSTFRPAPAPVRSKSQPLETAM